MLKVKFVATKFWISYGRIIRKLMVLTCTVPKWLCDWSALSISVPGVPSQSHHRLSRGRTLRYNNRDRPALTPYFGDSTSKLLYLQSFALTSMSFSDLPLLYCIIGGFLKMVLSNGWFSIKLHLCINVFFTFLTPGWYVTTNGNIFSWVFFFCFKADCLPAKETSDNVLSNTFLRYPLARRRVLKSVRDSLKFFFRRICS